MIAYFSIPIIYALIELTDSKATRRGLAAESPKIVAAALIALDQMPKGEIRSTDVIPHLERERLDIA